MSNNTNNNNNIPEQPQTNDDNNNNMLLTMSSAQQPNTNAATMPAASASSASPSSSSDKKQAKLLPVNWTPSKYDIICGRGSIALQHEGNQRLKALVQSMLPQYNLSACKFQKSKLVSNIVETVHQASPEGGFVKYVDDGWVRVTERHAREKVGQLFRDALHTKYKSSTKSKSKVRRDQKAGGSSGVDSRCDSPASLPSTEERDNEHQTTSTTTALHHQVIQQQPLGCGSGSLMAPLPIPSSITCLERPALRHTQGQQAPNSQAGGNHARAPSPVTSKKWNKLGALASPNSSSSSSVESATSHSLLPSTSLMSLTQHSCNRGSFSSNLTLPSLPVLTGAATTTTARAALPQQQQMFENDLESHFLSMNDPLLFLNQINDDNIDQVCDYLYDQL